MAHRLAVAGQPRGAVRHVALVLLFADRQAQVRLRAAAVDALAALGREERHDVVAGRDQTHIVAHPLHDPGALVPQHRGRVSRGIGAGCGVQVRVADAARLQAHQHLARARLLELHLLHLERRSELLQDCGADLHPRHHIRARRRPRRSEPGCAGSASAGRSGSSRRRTRAPRLGLRTRVSRRRRSGRSFVGWDPAAARAG